MLTLKIMIHSQVNMLLSRNDVLDKNKCGLALGRICGTGLSSSAWQAVGIDEQRTTEQAPKPSKLASDNHCMLRFTLSIKWQGDAS